MSIKEIKVPDIGHFSEVEVIEVAISTGMVINAEDTLVTLETEKASMDVPSPFSGKIQEVKFKVGDKVKQGDLIALIEIAEAEQLDTDAKETPVAEQTAPVLAVPNESVPTETTKTISSPVAPLQQQTRQTATQTEKEDSHDGESVHAGPATRRLARELGVDLAQVQGSGKKARVITKDVQAYVKSILQNGPKGNALGIEPAPTIDFSQFGEIEIQPLGRIKKWTAKNLHRNWVTIPHVTQFDEADITELDIFRQENKQAAQDNGIRLTPLAFIMKAVISALKHFPQFNASLDNNGTDLILKKYFHLGIAVDTPNGLVVPVVKDVDSKGLFDLARELGELSQLARDGKLKTAQMQGSCFSITSLGGVGGTAFTPIINAPDVAILGVSKAQIKPLYLNEQFVPRKMLPLSLSYDHRVIDGVEAAKFLNHITEQLQDIRKLLL